MILQALYVGRKWTKYFLPSSWQTSGMALARESQSECEQSSVHTSYHPLLQLLPSVANWEYECWVSNKMRTSVTLKSESLLVLARTHKKAYIIWKICHIMDKVTHGDQYKSNKKAHMQPGTTLLVRKWNNQWEEWEHYMHLKTVNLLHTWGHI